MSDPRFARIKTDPRFRRPKNKQRKVLIDDRFKSLFQDSKKSKGKGKDTPQVDKYGRKLSKTHGEDSLRKYYRLPRADEDPDEVEDEAEKAIDYARGQVLMESSDEEDDSKDQEDKNSDESDVDEIVRIGADDELEVDLDEDAYAELDAQVEAYAKANKDLEEKEDTGIVNRTRRLAVVNLDWDHVRASHLYKIFSSLVSHTAPHAPVSVSSTTGKIGDPNTRKSTAVPLARGSILSVRIYPSEFGKKRMEREEKEGPPAEIFKKKRKDTDLINEQTIYEVGDEDEYNADALRQYQLERLRYYYAIVECDTVEAASHLYNELDGTELERSANIFDLSFVPDDMTFDVDARDETTEDVSSSYKPLDFATDALRHSKVKLTWDEDDPERYQTTRRTLTQKEVEEGDFRTYIATSSSEDEDEGNNNQAGGKNEASRRRLRALLLDGNDHALPEGWNNEDGSDLDMEITFTPGLSEQKGDEDETTVEKYKRKMREKRKKDKEVRTEKKKAKEGHKAAKKSDNQNDEFFNFGSDSEAVVEETASVSDTAANHRIPSTTKATAGELALDTTSGNTTGPEPKHFNIKTILKAEKGKKRKKGKGKEHRKDEENELQEEFKIDVQDERFKALHEDHQFAIDPTNPHFQKTKGMKAFLEERQRRKRGIRSASPVASTAIRMKDGDEANLRNLVESVKRKTRDEHHSRKRPRQQ